MRWTKELEISPNVKKMMLDSNNKENPDIGCQMTNLMFLTKM